MSSSIPYSAEQDDLFYPCKRGEFFPAGRPESEAALCAELARLAYCKQESSFAYDQDKIRSILRGIGFSSCQFFESQTDPKGKGVHCFLASRDDKQLAIVAFRGTDKDDIRDWGFDLNAIPRDWQRRGKVHSGFAKGLDELLRNQKLGSALESIKCKLLFTGHSLGAAMATLLASLRNAASLYTFGSPRVGDADFVATLQGVGNHRFVDCKDLVTHLPKGVGYVHLGKPYYIDVSRKVTFDPSHFFMLEDGLHADLEYLEKYLRPGNVLLRGLADHAPINYVWPLAADRSQLPSSLQATTGGG